MRAFASPTCMHLGLPPRLARLPVPANPDSCQCHCKARLFTNQKPKHVHTFLNTQCKGRVGPSQQNTEPRPGGHWRCRHVCLWK